MRLDAGPVVVAGALVAGLLAGEHAGPARATGTLVVGACITVGALVTARWPRVVLAAAGIALLGSASMQRALDGREHSALTSPRDARTTVRLHGTIADDPDASRFSTAVIVRVEPAHRLVLVKATGRAAAELRVVAMGDRITVSGRLEPLDGFDSRLRWRHVVARLADVRLDAFAPPAGLLYRVANAVRSTILRGTTALAPRDRALFAGFALGDTRDLTDDVVDQFRAAGLSHLLAVSGANVAFVLALFGPLLRRTSLGTRLIVGASVVGLFATATRFEPSVLRASTMAVLVMVASFAGRPVGATRVLAIAVVVLLLADPFLLHSVGFGLSVGACAGIALLAGPIGRRVPGPRWFRDPVAVTLAAQCGVAPVMIPVFGGLPAVAPLANLLAVPVAEPLTIYGIVAAVTLSSAAPLRPLAALVHLPTSVMLRWVALVARTCARAPVLLDARGAIALAGVGCAVAALRKAGGTLRAGEVPPVPDAAPR